MAAMTKMISVLTVDKDTGEKKIEQVEMVYEVDENGNEI